MRLSDRKSKGFAWSWMVTLIALFIATWYIQAQSQQYVPDELIVKFRAGTSPARVDEINKQMGATILERSIGDPDLYRVKLPSGTDLDSAIRRYMQFPDVVRATKNQVTNPTQSEQQFVPDELLVKFRYQAPRSAVDQANNQVGATILDQSIGNPDLYRVKLQAGSNLDTTITRYMQNSDVVRVGKNLRTFPTETIPNDSLFGSQWSLRNTGTPKADIRATFAWDIKTGDPNLVIAVIDTGVD